MLEIAVFLCGAVIMVIELTGSRVLAPYLGTSLVVWTSLIGIILASLSLGYWWGGRLADRRPKARRLGWIYGLRRFRSRAPMTSPMMIEPDTRTIIVRYSIDIS